MAFGTYDRTRHPRVGVLVDGLRASGDEVHELNEPLRLGSEGPVALWRQPWWMPVAAVRLLGSWTRLVRRARQLRHDPPDAVLVGHLGHLDVRLARRLFPHTRVVLDHLVSASGGARDRRGADRGGGGADRGAGSDRRGGPGRRGGGGGADRGGGGLTGRLTRAIDTRALGDADLVVVDTWEHHAALAPAVMRKAVLAPVGASEDWFEMGRARRPRGSTGPLRVVFVGVFTPLHGARTIGAALAELAIEDIEVTMVGTGPDRAACRRAAAGSPRVTWLDWVPSARLPAFVGAHDVCLGIFGTTGPALEVVPSKVYQAAAAGCAVVTSDTPPQRAALADAAVFVPPGDARALAKALRGLAADRSEVAYLGAAAYTHAVVQFTPATVVRGLREAIARAAG